MIFVVIPVLLECMVRNLKYLTPFSTIANIMMAAGVAVVVYEATQDLPPIETRDYIASWEQLPLYFGTAIYAFEGIGLVCFFFGIRILSVFSYTINSALKQALFILQS